MASRVSKGTQELWGIFSAWSWMWFHMGHPSRTESSPGGFWDILGRAIPHPQSSRFNSLALPHTHPGAGETWKEEFLLLFSQGEALINVISGVSRLFFSCFCHIPPRIWGEWLDLWNPTQAMPTPFVSSFFYTGEMDQIPGE